jgi:HEAT repeat protein
VIAPDPLPQDYAAPRVFYVATNDATFEITMPDDAALHPGQAYDVTLPRAVSSDCVSIVLDESYSKTKAPNVGIAEVLGYTQFDQSAGSLDAIALSLRGGGQVADAASALLARAGKEGVAAIDRAWDKLDFTGRMLALDTAPASSCEDAAPVLAKGVLEADKQIASQAAKRLERCGKKAGPALALALEHAEATKAAKLLELFATLSPETALPAIAPKLGVGSIEERRASRHAFALAKNGASPATLGKVEKSLAANEAKLDFWRAVAPRAPDLEDDTKGDLFALAQSDDFATRWLVVEAMAALADKGDARAQATLESWLSSAREWPLRAHVAELWPKSRPMPPAAIARACADESPRVREALLGRGADAALSPCAKSALSSDAWPFVRVAAIHDLAIFPADPSSDTALAKALGDAAVEVRIAAANALGSRRAKSQSGALMARLEDTKEDSNVRAAVARALGEVCANEALPKLTSLAKDAALPQGSGQDLTLDMAAIEALGTLHPGDLKSRLGPVLDRRAPPLARAAATRALEREDVCKGGVR